jgi:hypothetical protein
MAPEIFKMVERSFMVVCWKLNSGPQQVFGQMHPPATSLQNLNFSKNINNHQISEEIFSTLESSWDAEHVNRNNETIKKITCSSNLKT